MSCNICSRTPTKRTATVRQIISFLEELGIPAARKSSYVDVEALKKFGLDIIQVRGGNFCGCYVGSRAFELPELKLLAGSVQSSKFITHKKPLGLSALPESDRVAAKTEPYPGRWTTHFVISGPSDLDESCLIGSRRLINLHRKNNGGNRCKSTNIRKRQWQR